MDPASGIPRSPVLVWGTAAEEAALAEVSVRAREAPSVARVVAFGSRVRGDFRGDSDLDVLVIVRDISSRDVVVRLLFEIEEKYDVPLAPVLYTVNEYEENRRLGSTFIANVEREGKTLYDAERG